MNFTRSKFGPDFNWGVSTAAYQIEGGYNADGKGRSIWDDFTATPGKIYLNQDAKTTCDFYHRYIHDINLMAEMKIPAFRFSLSWSRIIPSGTGKINPVGIEYYNRVIDHCLKMGVEPWITLYHWDLPSELEKKGGWTNREIIYWFAEYIELCIRYFGDRVKNWMILNEPAVFTGAGYFLGVHAPGRKGLGTFLPAIHHAALCQAEGGRIARSLRSDLKIGTTFSCSLVEPYRDSERDIQAAKRIDVLLNRLFVEPLAGLGYPVKDLKALQRLETYIKSGDEQKLAFNMDFIGVQNYTREIVAASRLTPLIWAKLIKAENRQVQTTQMNWEVYPESIYHMLHKFSKYKAFKEIIVTENGVAFDDVLQKGSIHDTDRKEFLQNYLAQVLKARNEGVNVNGYFVWSFTDNFEWAEGYRPRFGLVHVNFETQQRIIKDSGRWFTDFISG